MDVSVSTGGYTLRIFWLDDTRGGFVGTGDAFWITGSFALLPRHTDFTWTVRAAAEGFNMETGRATA